MTPLVRAEFKAPSDEVVAVCMREFGCDRDEALRRIAAAQVDDEVWINDLYQVVVHHDRDNQAAQLNIRRRDGAPIFRDWRHFQAIKNQLVGAECEAVELYPAESRLVDTTNKYHLFASTDPTFRFPFGWRDRDVRTEGGGTKGVRQRPIITETAKTRRKL